MSWDDEDYDEEDSAGSRIADLLDEKFGEELAGAAPYPGPLPDELRPWLVYLYNGGYHLAVALAEYWHDVRGPAMGLALAPPRTVLRCGYQMREHGGLPYVVAAVPDGPAGPVTRDGDEEWDLSEVDEEDVL